MIKYPSMNDRQLAIYHQQLMLMRTIQEVIDLSHGNLVLQPDDPRDAILEELDRAFCEAADNNENSK